MSRACLAGAILLAAWPASAGGPRAVNGLGEPMRWKATEPVIYHPDHGELGALSETTARTLVTEAFVVWADVGVLTFAPGGEELPGDINATDIPASNTLHWKNFWRVNDDPWSPVIFDDDGGIIDGLFGTGARFDILGIARIDTPIALNTQIKSGSIVINGLFHDRLSLPDSPEDVSVDALRGVIVHEIGHFLNLDHSLLNHHLGIDLDEGNDVYLPTMYPLTALDDTVFDDLAEDDRRALLAIYSTAAPAASVSGSVLSGGLPFQGAQVTLRRTSDPLLTAYSVVSGAYYFPCNPGSSCYPCQGSPCAPTLLAGSYVLDFIEPGDYTLCLEQLDRRFAWSNGTFVGPFPTPALLPGPEECRDAAESALATDDPDVAETLTAGHHTGKDLIVNALPTSDALDTPPNDSLADAYVLGVLPSGRDTAGAVLATADLDVYAVPVTQGQRIRIDIDSAELDAGGCTDGVTLCPASVNCPGDPACCAQGASCVPFDPVIAVYDATNQLVATSDDAIDPDSGMITLDPALELTAGFTGMAKIAVSSFPDTFPEAGLDASEGATFGGYWIRVEVASGDCPSGTDPEPDLVCDPFDNCPLAVNPGQEDADGDGVGDRCDPNLDTDPPIVTGVFPPDGAVDVALSSDIVVTFDLGPIDPATSDTTAIHLTVGGVKIPGSVRLSADSRIATFDPAQPLATSTDYTLTVTPLLRDLAGNPAQPFSAAFDTIADPDSGTSLADQYGSEAAGGAVCGAAPDDLYGSSVAVAGDIDGDTLSDVVVGAPGAGSDGGGSGQATLIFGGRHLQVPSTGGPLPLRFEASRAGAMVGASVARAGDLDEDDVDDFLIGAPGEPGSESYAGSVYVVFGDTGLDDLSGTTLQLDSLACGVSSPCVVELRGEMPGDLAGASIAFAGDVNDDDHDDLLIGAPHAAVNNKGEAGKVYLVYGQGRRFAQDAIDLASVGSPETPGIIFHGEAAGDRAGASVSLWPAAPEGKHDDLIIGAPGASPLDEFGVQVPGGGYVYAILGAALPAEGGVVELSRVGSNAKDAIAGMVFLGDSPEGEIGRSVTGEVDLDGDETADVVFSGSGEVWVVPGDGPKVTAGSSPTGGGGTIPHAGALAPLVRSFTALEAADVFGAVHYVYAHDADDPAAVVGPAGDVNADGIDDLIVGVPGTDSLKLQDAGEIYLVYGSPSLLGPEIALSAIGSSVPGVRISGVAAGDRLGSAVGGGDDVNADGVDDALAGAPVGDGPGCPSNAGAAYVLSPLAPAPVDSLEVEKVTGGGRLTWQPPDRAIHYNVYRSLLGSVTSTGFVTTSGGAQVACGIVSPELMVPGAPPTNADVILYLVTAENLFGESPLGPSHGAPPRRNDAPCP